MPTTTYEQPNAKASESLRFREDDGRADAILPSSPVQPQPTETPKTRSQDTLSMSSDSKEHLRKTQLAAGPLIRLVRGHAPHRRFQVLQHWEGVVIAVEDDMIRAELIDLGDRRQPVETVGVPIAEVPAPDRPLLSPGRVFYWSIGFEHSAGGQLRRVSEIRFRRTPEWSQHKIELIEAAASRLIDRQNNDAEGDPTAR